MSVQIVADVYGIMRASPEDSVVQAENARSPNNWSTLWAVADVAHGALELRRGHNNCSGVLDVFDVAAASV